MAYPSDIIKDSRCHFRILTDTPEVWLSKKATMLTWAGKANVEKAWAWVNEGPGRSIVITVKPSVRQASITKRGPGLPGV